MRRTKTVLGVIAVMVAMLVAFSAPAMANNTNDNNVQRSSSNIFDDNRHNDWFDNNHHNNWFDHRDNNDDVIFLVSDNDFDDFDDFDDLYPYWGWGYYPYWG
jgi:hypothetical protein